MKTQPATVFVNLFANLCANVLAILLALWLPMVAAAQPVQYGYQVKERKPQPRENFVQGLQIEDGRLYVSTGRRGESRLLRYDFASGKLEGGRRLHPQLFGEGLTLLDKHIFQLTWTAGMLLVYHRESLDYSHFFRLPGQGWGLTHNGRELIYSDGTPLLHYLSPQTGEHLRSLTVTENGRPLPYLNELEWVEGSIWANVWRSDRIVIIDPETGKVTASVDLTGLLPDAERREDTDVLNGIARNPDDGAIWVTGKRWPWLYRIELVPPRAIVGAPEETPTETTND